MPQVSVIIPVYNAEKYLRECLDSICKQTIRDIEIICVNDASTDKSLEILKEFQANDERIIIISNETNFKQGKCRNSGLNAAKGDYVGFVDSDDFVSINYFEELYNTCLETDSEVCVTPNITVYDDNKKLAVKNKYCGCTKRSKQIKTLSSRTNILMSSSVLWNKLYKREFLCDKEILNSELTDWGEDNLFSALSIFKAKNISVNNSAVYYYRCFHEKQRANTDKHISPADLIDVYDEIIEKIYEDRQSVEVDKLKNMIAMYYRRYYSYKTFFNIMSRAEQTEFNRKLRAQNYTAIPRLKLIQSAAIFLGYYKYLLYLSKKELASKELIYTPEILLLPFGIYLNRILDSFFL